MPNMKSSKKTPPIAALLAFSLALCVPTLVPAQEADSPIAACLKVWSDHPFGKNPQFKTLGISVAMFGIGSKARDTESTSAPSLVLVNPIFNVMGESTIELLNTNGWYCMRTTTSLIGNVNIRAHCKARLATTSDGSTVRANNSDNLGMKNLGVTVIGGVSIERPCN
jgi:hypothetical protein